MVKSWTDFVDQSVGASDLNRYENALPNGGAQAVGKGELALRVDDYGAVGNGSTDDAAAFGSALTAAGAVAGTVLLTAGKTYALGSSLTIPANVTLSGRATLQLLASNTSRAILVQNVSNVHLTGFTIDLNKSVTTNGGASTNQQGIYVSSTGTNSVAGITVQDITVKNGWQRGIAAVSSSGNSISDLTVTNCTVTSVGADGIFVSCVGNSDLTTPSTSQRIKIVGNKIISVGVAGIQVVGASYVTVDDNRLDGSGATGHGIVFSSSSSTSLVTDFTCTRNKISGFTNTTGQSKWGICVSVNCTRFTVGDNVITGCAGGMTVDVADTAFPSRVTLDVNGSVRGNVVKGSTASHGQNINAAANLAVTGNAYVGNALAGVACTNSLNCTVQGNTLVGNSTWGMAIFGTTAGTGGHTVGPNVTQGNTSGAVTTSTPPVACSFATMQSTP